MITREFFLTSTFDGPFYPGFLSERGAAVGRQSGGIHTFLRDLELHLGTGEPAVSALERVVAASEVLGEYIAGQPSAFFSESFQVDPFGTGRRLLRWRDELIMAGWDRDAEILPPRLKAAMNALASDRGNIPPGFVDRLLSAVLELAERGEKIFDAVYLLREKEKEPRLVQRLFEALENTGTRIEAWPLPSPPAQTGDLAAARAALETGEAFSPQGDGTLLRILGASPFEAGEALAAWLAENGSSGVVLIAGDRLRDDLDAAFRRFHLPGIGAGTVSPYRSALQILPLALSLQWAPLDPEKLLQFLQLSVSPIPRAYGRRLAEAVAESPGIGGPVWKEALGSCLDDAAEGRYLSRAGLEERFNQWLPDPGDLIPPGDGIEKTRFTALCDRLISWVIARESAAKKTAGDEKDRAVEGMEAGSGRDILRAASGEAALLKKLLDIMGSKTISRLQAVRLIELCAGEGVVTEFSEPEAGGVYTLSSPGAILGTAQTIIWWDFTRGGAESIPEALFTAEEDEALRTTGIMIPSRGPAAVERSVLWQRPFQYGASRVILVSHRLEDGEPIGNHPLWNQLAAGWDKLTESRVTIIPGELPSDEDPRLPARYRDLVPLTPPEPRRVWNFAHLTGSLREVESATSLEKIILCPFQYIVRYQAGLRPASAVSLKSGPLNLGSIGHRVIQTFLDKTVTENIETVLEEILTEEGALYLLPGREDALTRLRLEITDAAEKISRFIADGGFNIIGFERKISEVTELGKIGGYLDILLEGKDNHRLIIEMKYAFRGGKKYRKMLEDGAAIQLAVYRRLAGPDTDAAYFSLKDGQLLTLEGTDLPGGQRIAGPALAEVWSALTEAVETVLGKQFRRSLCAARGIIPDDVTAPDPYEPDGIFEDLPNSCKYCDYSALCGYLWQPDELREDWKKLKKKQKSN